MKALSIIIVNWNSKDFLRRCLDSIIAQTASIDFELIVIDSGSFDGCETMLRECFPQVRFLENENNVGFARSNNLAFDLSVGDSVLFLNPDTELVGPAVNIIHAALQRLPDAGVVGARLLNSDRTIQTSCIKAFPNLINQVLDVELLQKLFPRARIWGMGPLFNNVSAPAEVDVVSGACMIMRRSVFQDVGKFSTHYFIYSEDVDLCLKTRVSGLKNYYIPDAVIVHHGGGCTAAKTATNFSSVMALESRWRFFSKTRSRFYAGLYRIAIAVVSTVRITLLLALLAVPAFRRRFAPKCRAAVTKWWAGLRWTIGLESWVNSY